MLTPEQIRLRRSILTATDLVTLSGLYPSSRGECSVYLEKVEGAGLDGAETVEAELVDPDDDPACIRLGHLLEPMLIELVAEKHKLFVKPGTTLIHSSLPWLGATPDACTTLDPCSRPIECKVVGRHRFSHWGDGLQDVAPYVAVQGQSQMTVMGAPECFVSVFLGTEWRSYVVEHSPLLEEMMLETGHRFWFEHVVPRIMPAPDGTDDAWRMIKNNFPKVRRPELVVATAEWDERAREILAIATERARLEKEEKRLKQELAKTIGDWQGVRGDGWRALFQERRGYRVEAFEVAPSRVLDIKTVKTEDEKQAARAAKKERAA